MQISPAATLKIKVDGSSSLPSEVSSPQTREAFYEAGKKWFEAEDYDSALIEFEMCADAIEQETKRQAQPFDRNNIKWRNLDDYLCKCSMMVKREKLRDKLEERRLSKRTKFALVRQESIHPPDTATSRAHDTSSVRNLVVFVCNPNVSKLPHADDEAANVSVHFPAAIYRGATAEDLRRVLIEKELRRFLFIGHADAQVAAGRRTLGFTSQAGKLVVVRNDDLASMLGSSSTAKGGHLELVFLNGCCSADLGKSISDAGVPNVVCWKTRANDEAARIFSTAFFHALDRTNSNYRRAFEEGKRSVMYATKPGMLASSAPSDVPKFDLTDPDETAQADTKAAGIPLLIDGQGEWT